MIIEPITLEGRAVRLEPLSLQHLDALLEAGSDPGSGDTCHRTVPIAKRCAAASRLL